MATCPTCNLRDDVELEDTGDDVLIARPLGSHSLSGCQMKVSAFTVRKLVLRCVNCGWSADVYDGGNGFLYPLTATTEVVGKHDVD